MRLIKGDMNAERSKKKKLHTCTKALLWSYTN